MLSEHRQRTDSGPAGRILDAWPDSIGKFRKVMPRDYRRVLAERARRAAAQSQNGASSATAAATPEPELAAVR